MDKKESESILQRRPLPPKQSKEEWRLNILKNCERNKKQKLAKKKHYSPPGRRDQQILDYGILNCLKPLGPSPFPPRLPKKTPWQLTKRKIDAPAESHQMVHALPSKQNEFMKDNTISDCTHQPVSENEFVKYNSISDHPYEVPNEFSSIVVPANSQTLHVLDLNEMESLTEVSPRKPWRQCLLEEQAEENYNLSEECTIPHMCTKDKSISHSSCRSRYNICNTNSTNSTFYVSEEGLSQDSKNDMDLRKEILSTVEGSCPPPNVQNILTIEFDQDTVTRLVLNVDETKLYLKGYFLDMFEDVPDQLLATLSSVNLSFNNFMEIPEVLFKAKNLISLNMRNNPIKYISGDIKNLLKIKYMNFSFCCLNELQDCVLNLSKLEVLDVSYNCISRLNKSIKNLVSLKELYLDGNFIRHFPTELLQLSLTSFSCQTNFLHKYFWKESVPPILQSLRDVALTYVCKNHNLDMLPLDIKQKIGECGISPCDYCDQLKPHEGIPVLKPVAEIFGIKNLPLLFHVCSQSCRRSLLLASHLNDMK